MKLKSLIKKTFLSRLLFSHKGVLADQVESAQQQSDANEVPQCGGRVDSIVTQYFDRASASFESYVANTYAATEQIDNTPKLHIDINYNEKIANADMVSGVSMGAYLVNMVLNINDGTIQKLGSKTFFLNNKLQKLSLEGFGSLEIKYCPSKYDCAMFEVSGDAGNYELHINTNQDLELNHVYANGNIKIQSSGKLLANDAQAGSNNDVASIDIQARVLEIKEDLRASKNILIHTNDINISLESSLTAKHNIFVVAKSLARLDGKIVAGSRLVLRAEDEIFYDITKFHAKYVELQLAKASQCEWRSKAA